MLKKEEKNGPIHKATQTEKTWECNSSTEICKTKVLQNGRRHHGHRCVKTESNSPNQCIELMEIQPSPNRILLEQIILKYI